MGLLKSGDHVVCSHSVFGSTTERCSPRTSSASSACETTFVSQTDVAEWRDAMQPNTKLLFAETPEQPAHRGVRHRVPWLTSRTPPVLCWRWTTVFATPVLAAAYQVWAQTSIVHSGTKYLDGQGRVLAGAVCGTDAIVNGPLMAALRGGRHGRCRRSMPGWCSRGWRRCPSAWPRKAPMPCNWPSWLEQQPGVDTRVYYPGLPSRTRSTRWPWRSRNGWAARCWPSARGKAPTPAPSWTRLRASARFTCDRQQAACVDGHQPGRHQDLISHPASTSHGRLTEAQRQAAGITQGVIRVAVGLEHIARHPGRPFAWPRRLRSDRLILLN
jgi:O-succinylhomoserine sulfhydrylase